MPLGLMVCKAHSRTCICFVCVCVCVYVCVCAFTSAMNKKRCDQGAKSIETAE